MEKTWRSSLSPPASPTPQRQACKDAGRIAGLDAKRVISEPTAAAPGLYGGQENAQKVMVYDLGHLRCVHPGHR